MKASVLVVLGTIASSLLDTPALGGDGIVISRTYPAPVPIYKIPQHRPVVTTVPSPTGVNPVSTLQTVPANNGILKCKHGGSHAHCKDCVPKGSKPGPWEDKKCDEPDTDPIGYIKKFRYTWDFYKECKPGHWSVPIPIVREEVEEYYKCFTKDIELVTADGEKCVHRLCFRKKCLRCRTYCSVKSTKAKLLYCLRRSGNLVDVMVTDEPGMPKEWVIAWGLSRDEAKRRFGSPF